MPAAGNPTDVPLSLAGVMSVPFAVGRLNAPALPHQCPLQAWFRGGWRRGRHGIRGGCRPPAGRPTPMAAATTNASAIPASRHSRQPALMFTTISRGSPSSVDPGAGAVCSRRRWTYDRPTRRGDTPKMGPKWGGTALRSIASYGGLSLWVGTCDDILAGREGQYRVRLLTSHAASTTPAPRSSCCPDDAFTVATCLKYRLGTEFAPATGGWQGGRGRAYNRRHGTHAERCPGTPAAIRRQSGAAQPLSRGGRHHGLHRPRAR